MAVRVEMQDTIAIVTMDTPPVNAIGVETRAELMQAFGSLKGRKDISRIILTGTAKAFAAGADAREFDAAPAPPHLPDVVALIEAAEVPCIAAIYGPALGGGYELALACRYRIAALNALLGLPEVTLGVVPGAGGTQRLPRLIGIAKAAALICEGRSVKAEEALSLGLIDAVADDPLKAACELDLVLCAARGPLSKASAPALDIVALDEATARAAKHMRGQIAPRRALDLVRLSANADFAAGMQAERDTFLQLRASEQAKALRHIFFAERGARRPDTLKAIVAPKVEAALVIGGGTMGASIAYALNTAGITVTLVETDADAQARARANVGRLFQDAVKRGLMDQVAADARFASIDFHVGYDNLPPARLAIEAAYESMAVKKEIFAQLVKALPQDSILATNTSYLDVNEIAAAVPHPERVLGLHFFSPAHVMKLIEIVKADKTSDVALATGFDVAAKLKKIPVLAGVCDGFIGNRILARYREITDIIMMDGSLPWEIDEAMVEFGYPMGPYEAQDLSGLDIAFANRKRLAATRNPKRRYIPIADRMVEEGRLGKKVGVGWYRYPGGGGAVVDPLLEDMIREEAHFAKVTRRKFTHDEIRTRILTAMINEAAAILYERIAARAADIDIVLVHGYGFPRWRGGLMHYADTLGAGNVLANVQRFAAEDPVIWKPNALLMRLAQEGRSFASVGN